MSRMKRIVLLATALALLAAPAAASAQPYYKLVNPVSNKALMPKDSSTAWGTTIVQQPQANLLAQTWFVEVVGTSSSGQPIWRFRNRLSNRCIHPSDWSGLNGTRLLQATCRNNPEAKWERVGGVGAPYLRSLRTGKYMDIASNADGANAIQRSFTNSLSQRWLIMPAGNT